MVRFRTVRLQVTRLIHVDADVEAKKLVYEVTPEIPPAARIGNVSGTVVLHTIIGTNGRVQEIQYVSGPELLAKAAMDAALWRIYWVTTIRNEPVRVDTTIDVSFPPTPDTN